MVLCHNATRQTMKGYDAEGLPIRPLRDLIRIYEDAASWRRPPGYPPARVVAIAMNTGDTMDSGPFVDAVMKSAAHETKLAVADPIREGAAGADRLAQALLDAVR